MLDVQEPQHQVEELLGQRILDVHVGGSLLQQLQVLLNFFNPKPMRVFLRQQEILVLNNIDEYCKPEVSARSLEEQLELSAPGFAVPLERLLAPVDVH